MMALHYLQSANFGVKMVVLAAKTNSCSQNEGENDSFG
jgi:hypothetical protein